MKRNKVFLALIIAILAIAALATNLLSHPKFKYFFSKPTTYAQCVEASGAILESYPSQCVFKGQHFTNPDEQAPAAPSDANLKTYQDSKYNYSVQYPAGVFTEFHAEEPVPFDKPASYPVTSLTHQIPVQQCGLSGRPQDCSQNTVDISIDLIPLDMAMADAIAASRTQLGELQDTKLGTYDAKTTISGAEGEGKYYYFVALSDKATLLIVRSFIDETVVSKYQTAKDFIPKAEQEKLFNQVVGTLSIQKSSTVDTSSWKQYSSKGYNFTLKYPADWVSKVQDVNIVTFNSPGNEKILANINAGKEYGEGYQYDIMVTIYNKLNDEPALKNGVHANTLEEFIQNNQDIHKDYQKISVGNEIAYKTMVNGFGEYLTIYLMHNNHLYEIQFTDGDRDILTDQFITAFLSTFSFTK